MRTTRLILAALAAAVAFGPVPNASAQHRCVGVGDHRPICVLPHYCVMYEDGTIVCYD